MPFPASPSRCSSLNSPAITLEAEGSPGPDELIKALARHGADPRVALAEVLGWPLRTFGWRAAPHSRNEFLEYNGSRVLSGGAALGCYSAVGGSRMALQNPIRYPWSEGADCFVYPPVATGEHPGQQHPVLCFLHGREEATTGKHPDGVAAHKSPAWHANNRSPLTARFLVVCPQRRDVGRWTDSDAGNFHLVLDEVIAEHNGDADQVFLTGFSLGGDAVFWFAHYDRGNRFQKLWAVDPAIQDQTPVPAPGRPVLLHHGVRMRDVVTRFQGQRRLCRPGVASSATWDYPTSRPARKPTAISAPTTGCLRPRSAPFGKPGRWSVHNASAALALAQIPPADL